MVDTNFVGKYVISDVIKMLQGRDNILIKAVCFVDYEAHRLLTLLENHHVFFSKKLFGRDLRSSPLFSTLYSLYVFHSLPKKILDFFQNIKQYSWIPIITLSKNLKNYPLFPGQIVNPEIL